MGQIDLARLCALDARFEHTYLTNPRLFAKLDCRLEDFEKEVALLLQRWRKDTKGVGEKAILRQHGNLHPVLLSALRDALGITTELFASPLNHTTDMPQYRSADPRDQLFGAVGDAYEALRTGACFAHPPETDQDVERAVRSALSCARAQQKDPILVALLLPGHPFNGHARLTDFPEVCPVGTFKWDAPILQTPAAWMAPPSTNPAPATASPRRLGLYLIGNELGHQSYQREALFRALTHAYYRLHMSHEVSRRYNDMFDWDPEAPRAARQCEDNFHLSKYR